MSNDQELYQSEKRTVFSPKFFGLEKYTRCSTFEFEFKGENDSFCKGITRHKEQI